MARILDLDDNDVIESKNGTYKLGALIASVDVCNLYHCTRNGSEKCIFKIVRNQCDNDLGENEADILANLVPKLSPVGQQYFPKILDSFTTEHGKTKRFVTVSPFVPNYVSIKEILETYPNGVHPLDAVWMINRMLETLTYAHSRGFIHGGIVPTAPLIGVENHGLCMTNWFYALMGNKSHIKAIVPEYKAYYPPEVMLKQHPTPGTDIYMVAKCAIKLLGGNPENDSFPESGEVPVRIQGFLKSCLIASLIKRPDNASQSYEDFRAILKSLYGKREFRKFIMPVNATVIPV